MRKILALVIFIWLLSSLAIAAVPTAPTIDHPQNKGKFPAYFKDDLRVETDDVGFIGDGSHESSDWEWRSSSGGGTGDCAGIGGAVLYSSCHSPNKLTWTIPASYIGAAGTYYVRVRHTNVSGDSSWTEHEVELTNNGIVTELPSYLLESGKQHDSLVEKGFIPVTYYHNWNGVDKCDNTFNEDCKNVINHVISIAHEFNMTTFFPAGTYKTSGLIQAKSEWHISRYKSPNMQGSYAGAQPTIKLAATTPSETFNNNPSCTNQQVVLNPQCTRSGYPWSCCTGVGTGNCYDPYPCCTGAGTGSCNYTVQYDDDNYPNPVIWVWNEHDTCWAEHGPDVPCDDPMGNNFNTTIRNIKVDTNDHEGACAIFFKGPQGSSLGDFTADVTNSFCGIWRARPTAGGGTTNLSITGGKYGIYFDESGRPGNYANVTLTGQTVAAIRLEDVQPTVFTGLSITKAAAPAIITEENWGQGSGTLIIHDGKIEITTTGGTIISNAEGQPIYLRNVYMKGPSGQSLNAVQSGSESAVALDTTGNWNRIDEYSYTNQQSEGGFTTYNIISGGSNRTPEPISPPDISWNVGTPPSDLLSRHSWGTIPDPEDVENPGDVEDVVNDLGIDNTGETDVTTDLQNAIDTYDKLYFPRGNYLISATLDLDDDSYLFGLSDSSVHIRQSSTWQPTDQAFLVRTPDSSDANIFFSDMSLRYYNPTAVSYPSLYDWMGCYHHRAGPGSVIRSIDCMWSNYVADAKGQETQPHVRYLFSGNAAGKIYGWTEVQAGRTDNAGYHSLKIYNCDGPLIFYDFNPEHAVGNTTRYDALIESSSNVKIYAIKDEHDNRGWLEIVDSQNIMVLGYNGINVRSSGYTGLKIRETGGLVNADILIYGLNPQYTGASYTLYVDNVGVEDNYLLGTWHLALFKKGEFTDFGMCVPATPSITNPTASEVDVPLDDTMTSTAFADQSGCSTSHISSDWEIDTTDEFLSPDTYSYSSETNKTTWTPGLPENGELYIRVRHTNLNGDSAWSAPIYFETEGDAPAGGTEAVLLSGDNNVIKWSIINCEGEEITGVKITGAGNSIYNSNIVNCGVTGLDVDADATVKNVILRDNAGEDLNVDTGITLTCSNMSIEDSDYGNGTLDGCSGDLSSLDPRLSASNIISRMSPASNRGTDSIYSGVETDILGQSVTDGAGNYTIGSGMCKGASEYVATRRLRLLQ